MSKREGIITYGFENGKSVDEVNRALSKAKERGLGPRETGLYESGRWGTTPLQRVGKDFKDIGSGLNTIATAGNEWLTNLMYHPKETIDETSRAISNYAKEKGVGGAVVDVANLIGSPYGLTTDEIGRRGMGNVLYRLPGMMWAHPAYTTIDVGMPGFGLASKHQIGNLLTKSEKVPQVLKDFIPSSNISKVNEIINSSRGEVGSATKQLMKEYQEAKTLPDVDWEQVMNNLQNPKGGIWKGNENTLKATRLTKTALENYDKELVALGAKEGAGKRTAIAQFMMENVNPLRDKPVTTSDFLKYIDTGKTEDLVRYGVTPPSLGDLATIAGRLYDQGVIYPVTHSQTFRKAQGRPGLVTSRDKALGQLADREYGWATAKELYPTLDKALGQYTKDITDTKAGRMSLRGILDEFGTKVVPSQLDDLKPNELVISPRALEDAVKEKFELGQTNKANSILNKLSTGGLGKELWNEYKDDLYRIDKSTLRPLANASKATRVWKPLKNLNSTWKTAQLITPKYFVENRLGNWTLNFIEGVGLKDYLDALQFKPFNRELWTGKYYNLRPERLKSDTSYYGVLGEEFAGTKALSASKQALNEIKAGFKDRDIKRVGKGTYDIFTAPMLGLESTFEGVDRYANFIKQAKRMSKQTGESVENIIKRSNTDRALYNELMGRVNRSLGDYIGRNWAIDPELYEGLTMAFPFFKYPTQGLRTLAHQAMSNPLNYMAKVTLPQRIGSEIWNKQLERFPGAEDEEGGLIERGPQDLGILHQTDIHPLGAGAGMVASGLTDWRNINISPLFSIADITRFQDRYGNPASSPNYINYKGKMYKVNDQGIPLPKEARPGLGDRTGYTLSRLANTFVPGVIATNRYVGPMLADIINKPWYSNYDTSIFGQIGDYRIPRGLNWLVSGKTDRMTKPRGSNLLQQLSGTKTRIIYPKQSIDSRTYRGLLKKYQRNQILKKNK